MKLLIDTHLFLWTVALPRRLPKEAYAIMADRANELTFSAAGLWEYAIKHALGRPDFTIAPQVLRQGLLNSGFSEVAVVSEHGIVAGGLPRIHKDPFDRILIAQAQVEGLLLLTSDAEVARYPGPIRLV